MGACAACCPASACSPRLLLDFHRTATAPAMNQLSAFLVVAALVTPALRAELEDDIPLGVEAVTGIRSGYVYRGFDLADALMDFHLETEIVLQDHLALAAGGWFATEVGDKFNQASAYIGVRYDLREKLTAELSASYHTFDHSTLEDGLDLGASLTWYPDRDWDLGAAVHRDSSSNGWYVSVEGGWSHPLSEDAFLALNGGVSAVEDYYGRSGLNDIYGRASLTYNINSMLSLTPFIGWSFELNDGDGNEVYGGLWFEVSF